ncbi:sensor histidine kinase [Bacteroidota bacterium]
MPMKQFFIILTVITSLALAGIIITQLYWMNRAYELKYEQFNTQVNVSLKAVSNKIFDYQLDSAAKYNLTPCDSALFQQANITEIINPVILDSLIFKEFSCLYIDNYNYGVYNKQNKNFVMGNYNGFEDELTKSQYKIIITCLYNPDIYVLSIFFPDESEIIFKSMLNWIIVSLIFLLLLVIGYIYILLNLMKQKKLSEMKNDFINNITHEFKTPISTISVAGEMLQNKNINTDPDKVKRYSGIILGENTRIQNQVDQILQLSIIDKEALMLNKIEFDAHKVINDTVESFELYIGKREAKVILNLNANSYRIYADVSQFINIVSNILDNAIKYSPEYPKIEISTKNDKDQFVISIKDYGIGISRENQKQVFKKLYRVSTGDLHDAKGFGIGLYYVKKMVEEHGGSVILNSEINKGSTFTIKLPMMSKNNE